MEKKKKIKMGRKKEIGMVMGVKMCNEFEITGDTIVIPFNRDSLEISGTGKSVMLASSKGFKWKDNIGVSFNVIKKKG